MRLANEAIKVASTLEEVLSVVWLDNVIFSGELHHIQAVGDAFTSAVGAPLRQQTVSVTHISELLRDCEGAIVIVRK